MNTIEQAQRARVVGAAKSWLGTKYHSHAMIKGVACDCATLLVAVMQEAGMVGEVNLPWYSPQWHLHSDEEKYSNFIAQFGAEVTREPLPGDVVVFRMHRSYSHGGIVVEWPKIIHSWIGIGVFMDNVEQNQVLSTVSERVPTQGQPRPRKVFSVWGH